MYDINDPFQLSAHRMGINAQLGDQNASQTELANLERMRRLFAAQQAAEQQAAAQAMAAQAAEAPRPVARVPNPDGSPQDMNMQQPEVQGPPAPEPAAPERDLTIQAPPRENLPGFEDRQRMLEQLRGEQAAAARRDQAAQAAPPAARPAIQTPPPAPTVPNPAVTQPEMGPAQSPTQGAAPAGADPAQLNPYGNDPRAGENRGGVQISPLVETAKKTVASEPKGFMDKLQGWMGQIGRVFDPAAGGEDPAAIHPGYGVPNSQVWQAQRAALFNAGVLLMAAGQPNTPEMRSKLIAEMGPTLRNVSKDIYNTAQAQLMNAQAKSPNKGKNVVRTFFDNKTQRTYQEYDNGEIKAVGSTPPSQESAAAAATKWVTGGFDDMSQNRADKLYQNIKGADEALTFVSDDMIAGTGSDIRTKWGTLKNTFGSLLTQGTGIDADADWGTLTKEDKRKLLDAYVTKIMLPMLSQVGGNDSDREMATMRAAIMGGDWSAAAIRESLSNIRQSELDAYNDMMTYRRGIEPYLFEGARPMKEPPELLGDGRTTRERVTTEREAAQQGGGGEQQQAPSFAGSLPRDKHAKVSSQIERGETAQIKIGGQMIKVRRSQDGKLYYQSGNGWQLLKAQ